MPIFNTASAPLLTAASALFLAGGYLSFGEATRARAKRLIAGVLGEDRVGSALDESGGMDRIGGLLVEARPGRSALVDHVVRGGARLVVVETKNWSGSISGGPNDREWSQAKTRGERKVQRNPLMQAKRQAKILSEFTGVPVAPLVVMAGRGTPASGSFPDGVVTIRDLGNALPRLLEGDHRTGTASRAEIDAAWARLVDLDGAPDARRRAEAHAENTESKYGRREWVGWMAMAIAAAAASYGVSGPADPLP